MIAILSDIHGNLPALEAVLFDLPPAVREVWVLGDLVGELPFPRETIDALVELGGRMPVRCVAGNREVSLLEAHEGRHPGWWAGTQMRALAWTADQLDARHWAYLKALPLVLPVDELPGGALLYHGSPTEVRGETMTWAQADAAAGSARERWLLGGHTHEARLFYGDGWTVVNAGSVGISQDWIGSVACYALIDTGRVRAGLPGVSFRHVGYDVERTERALEERGVAEMAPGICRAMRLEMRTGGRYLVGLMEYAHTYAARVLGGPVVEIPPDVWRAAETAWMDEVDGL